MKYVHPITEQRDALILRYMRENGSITKHDTRLITALRAANCRVGKNANYHLGAMLCSMWERRLIERRKTMIVTPGRWASCELVCECWEYFLTAS